MDAASEDFQELERALDAIVLATRLVATADLSYFIGLTNRNRARRGISPQDLAGG